MHIHPYQSIEQYHQAQGLSHTLMTAHKNYQIIHNRSQRQFMFSGINK